MVFKVLLIEAVVPERSRTMEELAHPIGPMYLAACLRKDNKDRYVEIFDTKLSVDVAGDLEKYMSRIKPDLIGIKSYSRDSDLLYSICRLIKTLKRKCITVTGGPYANAMGKNLLKDPCIDISVLHEGEITFVELINKLEKREPISDVKGIIYKKKGEIIETPPRPLIEKLDEIPFPAYDMTDDPRYNGRYHMSVDRDGKYPDAVQVRPKAMTIFTTRGCPYKCIYCHNIFGKKFRARSAEHVWEEMKLLYNDYGVHQFFIWDDIFNLDKKRVHKICDYIIKSGYDIKLAFPNGLRGDIMDKEMIFKLKEAGTFFITYAIETGSPRLQKMIKKYIDLEKLNEIITITSKEAWIATQGFFMFGFPTETKEELYMTIDYAVDSDLDFCSMFIVNPFEGTELAEMAKKYAKEKYENYEFDYYNANYSLAEVSIEELKKIHTEAQVKFHSTERVERAWEKVRYYREH